MDWLVRPEREGDAAAIHRIHAAAFGRPDEADLVRALRDSAEPYLGLVAEATGAVAAHVVFSPVTVEHGAASRPLLALGPLAVDPALQRRGAGAALVEAGLRACAERGVGLVFVLGHPAYYPRFRFAPALPRFLYQSAERSRAFFVRELVPGAADGLSGRVAYHPAFDGS